MKFKHKDIVVIENSSHTNLPANSVVKIEEYAGLPLLLVIRTFQRNHFQMLSTFLQDCGKLRLATQREQFLYYILGPHVLGEESEI